jgi:uncharacterized protein (DUF2147 family)
MRKFLILTILVHSLGLSYSQSPVGTWATIDDETGQMKSHIKITEKNGTLTGTIVKLLIKPESDKCTKCTGDKKDKPLIGLSILSISKKEGNEWVGGSIVDPKNGKTYKCTLRMESENKMAVRGYIGFSLIGRTQTWKRVQ